MRRKPAASPAPTSTDSFLTAMSGGVMVPDSTDTQITFSNSFGATVADIGQGAGFAYVGNDTASDSFEWAMGFTSFFVRLRVLWSNSFTAYKSIWAVFAATGSAHLGFGNPATVAQTQPRLEMTHPRFMELDFDCTPFINAGADRITMTLFARQESGGLEGLGASCEIYLDSNRDPVTFY